MIITIYGIIVFQLVERIAMIKKSLKEVFVGMADISELSYLSLRSRHEVHGKPYLQEE